MLRKFIFGALVSAFALPLSAQETPHAAYRETGSSKDWVGIYSPDRGIEKPTSSCAIYSRPKSAAVYEDRERIEAMRGELAAFISWNGGKVSETSGEVSFMVGLPVQEGPMDDHVLTIDGEKTFPLVGVADRLYVRPEDDEAVVVAIRGGMDMVVTARAADGKLVKDGYSLLGVQHMTNVSMRECR